MIVVEKILFLRRVSLFSKMTTEQLEHLARVAAEAVFPAGSRVIEQGEEGDRLFLIVEGEILIHCGETRLAILKSEDCFGEMSVIDGEPRSASATALTDCLTLSVGQQDFKDIVAANAGAAWAVIQTLSRRLREATFNLQQAKGVQTDVSTSK